MTTFREILSAIAKKIKDKFPDITIETRDIEEGIKRPSFSIELDNIKISDYMQNIQEKRIRVRINYFPSKPNKNQIELLEKQDALTEIFIIDGEIWLDEEMCIPVEEVDLFIMEKVLHCDFDIYLSEEYNRPEHQDRMTELDMGFN